MKLLNQLTATLNSPTLPALYIQGQMQDFLRGEGSRFVLNIKVPTLWAKKGGGTPGSKSKGLIFTWEVGVMITKKQTSNKDETKTSQPVKY